MVTFMRHKHVSGFTLMELIVVLVILSLMASISVPVVTTAVQRANESALRETLLVTRKALDDYYADHGSYPNDLGELVEKKYLRSLPVDPMVKDGDDWELITGSENGSYGIRDIKSSSTAQARDGSHFNEW